MLQGNDIIGTCGVEDGSTVHVMERLRDGGMHKDKKSNAEKKQAAGQESVSDEGPALLECEMDKVIHQIEENDQHREIVAYLSEGNDELHFSVLTPMLNEFSSLCQKQWLPGIRGKKEPPRRARSGAPTCSHPHG